MCRMFKDVIGGWEKHFWCGYLNHRKHFWCLCYCCVNFWLGRMPLCVKWIIYVKCTISIELENVFQEFIDEWIQTLW